MDSSPAIAAVIPQYGAFDYTLRAVETFHRYTPEGVAIVVDDASPDWTAQHRKQLMDIGSRGGGIVFNAFETNSGLTAAWNYGLGWARDLGATYTVCTNSDILFTPFWYRGLIHMLEEQDQGNCEDDRAWRLVGPVTNCPGAPQYGKQNVKHFFPYYKVTDDPQYMARVAEYLREHYWTAPVEDHVNGFLLMARTETWWEGRFDKDHVFCPRNDFNSKGQRNPTPLMTLNEDELQRRWRERGWRIGFTPSSFIFHYRAVSRGPKHAHVEGAYRAADKH